MVSIMPGIEARAPERTESRSGFSASPKRAPRLRSTLAMAATISALTARERTPSLRLNSPQTSVEIVKPGGTGIPRVVISARLAPFPPSRALISASPSALPSPKE